MNDNDKTKADLIREVQKYRKESEFVRTMYHKGIAGPDQATKILHDIIEKNPLSIQIVDKEGITIQANQAHRQLFKAKNPPGFSIFKDSQLIGQGLKEWFDRLKNGEVVYFPDTLYNAHALDAVFPDNPVYIRVIGFPVFDANNEPERFILMHEDITARKLAEEELKTLNQKLHVLTKHIQEAIEMEREEISKEIKDDLGQKLCSIKTNVGLLKDKIKDPSLSTEANKIFTDISETIATSQNLARQLSPVILEKLGLKEAILAFASEFEGRYQIKTITNIPDLSVLNMDISLAIFRMLQESLTNAAKHAQASEVKVSIQCGDKQLKFSVEDNGRGINAEQINSEKSYGILSMKERTKTLGGSFSIKGKVGKGTQILIKLPLSQNHQ